MGYLTDQDYVDLPEDDGEAFCHLESISRDRLHASPRDRDDDIHYEDVLRYMNEVSALASEFRLAGLEWNEEADNYTREFARFTRAVDAKLAQIRVQRSRRDRRNSVALSGSSREKMQHHLERLKVEVSASNLPEKRQAALLDKITEFEAELAKPRFNLALAMSFMAMVTTVAHDAGEILVSAPTTTQAFLEIIGKEKQEEIDKLNALPRYVPPKQLEYQGSTAPDYQVPKSPANPRSKTSTSTNDSGVGGGGWDRGFTDDLDDDIPF